jgi:hypothetical protein
MFKKSLQKSSKQGVVPVSSTPRDMENLQAAGRWMEPKHLHQLQNSLLPRWKTLVQYLTITELSDSELHRTLSTSTWAFACDFPIISHFSAKADRPSSAVSLTRDTFEKIQSLSVNGAVYWSFVTHKFKTSAHYGTLHMILCLHPSPSLHPVTSIPFAFMQPSASTASFCILVRPLHPFASFCIGV